MAALVGKDVIRVVPAGARIAPVASEAWPQFSMRRVLRYASLSLERRGELDVALARLLSSRVALGGCRSRECGFGNRFGGANQTSETFFFEHVGGASFVGAKRSAHAACLLTVSPGIGGLCWRPKLARWSPSGSPSTVARFPDHGANVDPVRRRVRMRRAKGVAGERIRAGIPTGDQNLSTRSGAARPRCGKRKAGLKPGTFLL
jgi:hypothetical protein